MVIEFFIISLIIVLSAGPVINWVAQVSADKGKITAFFGIAGLGTGLSIVAVACGIVIYAIGQQALIMKYLPWAAAAYLFYLCWCAFTYKTPPEKPISDNRWQVLWTGLKFAITDFRVYLFFLALLPLFIGQKKPLYEELLLLYILCIGLAAKVNGVVALAGKHAKSVLSNPKYTAVFSKLSAACLALAGIFLLVK